MNEINVSNAVKQVIVLRDKFPDGRGGFMRARKGKMAAQACHATRKFLVNMINYHSDNSQHEFSDAEIEWLDNGHPTICVRADSDEHLLELHKLAKESGLKSNLITDSGKTEFHGVATNTALAIGPDFSEKIDPITKDLELL